VNEASASGRAAIEPGAANGPTPENFPKCAGGGERDDVDSVAPKSVCNLGFRTRTDDHRRTQI
jgi:hypothetical protein